MGLIEVCPECGFESSEVRCPRCNTLKVVGCSGSCWACSEKSACSTLSNKDMSNREEGSSLLLEDSFPRETSE